MRWDEMRRDTRIFGAMVYFSAVSIQNCREKAENWMADLTTLLGKFPEEVKEKEEENS